MIKKQNILNIIGLCNIRQSIKFHKRHLSSLKYYKDIPGPKSYPIIGSLLETKSCGGDLDVLSFRDFLQQLHTKYGEIVRWRNPEFDPKKWTQNNRNVFLSNPEHIKRVFKADGNTPVRPELEPLNKLHKQIGVKFGLVNSQYERWRKLRSLSNPIAARLQTIHLYLPDQNQVADELVGLINEHINTKQNQVFGSFEEYLRLLTLEYISEIVFNKRLRCMDKRVRTEEVTRFVQAVDDFSVYSGRLVFSPPLWKIYRTQDWIAFETAGIFMYNECKKYIEKAKNDLEMSSNRKQTILGEYLNRKDSFNLSIDDITAILSEFLIGGVDTTAVSLYYLLYELGSNKDIQEKLFNEITSIIKPNESVTEDHLAKFKYLKLIVKESQRLHAVAPTNSRILQEDLIICNYLIPKGTHMLFSNSYITRSEKYFKDPLKFMPSRWEEGAEEKVHLYTSLPFGTGIRVCLGQRIAMQEIYLTLIKLVQNFEIHYLGEKPGFKIALIASPDIELKVSFRRR